MVLSVEFVFTAQRLLNFFVQFLSVFDCSNDIVLGQWGSSLMFRDPLVVDQVFSDVGIVVVCVSVAAIV